MNSRGLGVYAGPMGRHQERHSDSKRAEVLAVLAANGGNVARTARDAGVSQSTIRNWRAGTRGAPSRPEDPEAVLRRQRQYADRLKRWALVEERVSCVYLVECDGFHKIGISSNLPARLAAMQSSSPHEIAVDLIVSLPDRSAALQLEQGIHSAVWHRHHRGEWFSLDGESLGLVRRLMRETIDA